MASSSAHPLSTLTCPSLPPSASSAVSELIYWEENERDSHFVSPYHQPGRYITFESDHGGWNNIRMAMETILALAAATGRTLVLPPEAGMYLLDKDKEQKENNKLDFEDFFHMESIAEHLDGVDVITMEQFLEREAKNGMPRVSDETGEESDEILPLPRDGLTDWSGVYKQRELFDFLRDVAYVRNMKPQKDFLVFPKDPAKSTYQDMVYLVNQEDMFDEAGEPDAKIEPRFNNQVKDSFVGKPVKVSAPAPERMREFYAGRGKMHVYDKALQDAKVLHFPVDHNLGSR